MYMQSSATDAHRLRTVIAKNTLAQVAARVASAASTFIITLILARKFGANGFGDFVKITTFIAFFYLLSDFGINAVFLQKDSSMTTDAETSTRSWDTLVFLRLILSTVLILVSTIIIFLLPRGYSQGYTYAVRLGILMFAPTIIFQSLTTSANALFQKHFRYDLSAYAVIIGSLLTLVLVAFTVYSSAFGTIMTAVVALFIGSAVTALSALYFAKQFRAPVHSKPNGSEIAALFYASIPLGATLLFNLVYFRIDSVILTLTRTTAEVGIYGLAYKMFELPLIIPTFFMNALYPVMLANLKDAGSFNIHKQLLAKAAGLLFCISVLLPCIFWAGAPLLTYIKSDFVQSISALRILSLGLPFFFLTGLTMWTLIAYKKQRELAVIYAFSMVINITANILFVPSYGYMAAAWITLASEAIVLVLSGITVFSLLKHHTS